MYCPLEASLVRFVMQLRFIVYSEYLFNIGRIANYVIDVVYIHEVYVSEKLELGDNLRTGNNLE